MSMEIFENKVCFNLVFCRFIIGFLNLGLGRELVKRKNKWEYFKYNIFFGFYVIMNIG